MTALRKSLSDETPSRDQMLNAREREVIENHLTGEVATELQGLIRAGEDWVLIAMKNSTTARKQRHQAAFRVGSRSGSFRRRGDPMAHDR